MLLFSRTTAFKQNWEDSLTLISRPLMFNHRSVIELMFHFAEESGDIPY